MEENNKITIIKSEKELPPGKVISYKNDILEISESARKQLLAWDISIGDEKLIWLLYVKEGYKSNSYMQLEKNAEHEGYKIVRKVMVDPIALNEIYQNRSFFDKQNSTSDDNIVESEIKLMLADALAENVSDIHIEVRPNGSRIRMRKNGELMDYKKDRPLSYKEANNLAGVIYNVLAVNKDVSFDPRDSQQAAVPYDIKGQELKLRYQSVPAYPDGYDVILRVLIIGRSEDFEPLQKLGYTEQQVQELINISSRPIGSLVVAGVTGSGKSTTLKNLLMYLNAHSGYRSKIYTIEDPPEYNIAKVTQIPVIVGKDTEQNKVSPFEKPIKACMRADPDIIMIGEVRDSITGDLTKKAVQSGHQVLTTTHSTSALGIIDRFQDFGITRSVLGSPNFLSGLVYQTLLPVVCDKCSIDFNKHIKGNSVNQLDILMYEKINKIVGNIDNHNIKIRNKNGCEECKYSGIRGRSVAAEVIMIDLNMLQFIEKGEIVPLMLYWRNLSDKNPSSANMKGKTSMEHGFLKVLNGLVCPYDLEASFKPIEDMLTDIEIKNEKTEKDDGWNNL